MNPSRTYLLCLAAMAALSSGCFLRTGYVLEALNAPSEPETPPLPISLRERVGRLTRSHLTDAYANPAEVARWMSALGSAPEPILEQAECLRANAGGSNATCYDTFLKKTLGGGVWGLPAAPRTVDPSAPTAAEVDTQRFLANALGIASSLVAFGDSLSDPLNPHHVTQGLREGAESTAQYISARRWSRKLGRPSNAVVLSGGGANGAFSAGAMWRLLGILESCRGKPAPEGCGDARIDLAAGTSTGALISTMVDLFHTPGQEKKARDVLISNYTCSVESDLYCVNSTWVWKIASDLKGLVRFDGVQNKLRDAVVPAQLSNGTELVAVSVDFNTGDVHGISDQDPATFPPTATDAQKVDGLINAVLASIVEPVLAEPVPWVPSREGRLEGTFLDGGVRSGLPLLQAVQRGAERVLILSTRGLQTPPTQPPENAVSTLMRTIDLFVAQPFVGEVQQAELAAVSRRFAEYNVCSLRLAQVENPDAVPAYCQRTGQGFVPVEPKSLRAATSMWMGPAHFGQVASSWRATWMFRPESSLETANGYSFSPKVMRPLFKDGVKTLQQRCAEVLRLFEIHGSLAQDECARPVEDVVQEAESRFAPEGECTRGKPDQRSCD